MSGVKQQISSTYIGMNCQDQILLLVRIVDWFSLAARDTYEPGCNVSDPVRLRAFNEAINRVATQLLRLVANDKKRYPDDVFSGILINQFEMLGLNPKIILALSGH